MLRIPRRGFSLIELLVGMTFFAVVTTSIVGVLIKVQQGAVTQRANTVANESLYLTEMFLARLLRGARADPSGLGLGSLLPDPMATGKFDNLRVKSDYNPADGDVLDPLEDTQVWVAADTLFVRWQAAGATEPFATPVKSIKFEYYDLAGIPQTSAGAAATAKRVKMTITAPNIDAKRKGGQIARESWITIRN